MHAIRDVSVVEAPLGLDEVAARVDRMLCSTKDSVCLAHGRIIIPMSKARIDEERLLKNVEGARLDWGMCLVCLHGDAGEVCARPERVGQYHLCGD